MSINNTIKQSDIFSTEPGPVPFLIQPRRFTDSRGFFTERFRQDVFTKLGLSHEFAQDNFSHSLPGVLRGLHYQHTPAQGKLVTCTNGAVFDVAVDLRPGSPTFGRWQGVELTAKDPLWFWIPAGFAHGFCVLGKEPADVWYKVDTPYNPDGEGGIVWNDPTLCIKWPIEAPLISPRDANLPQLNMTA